MKWPAPGFGPAYRRAWWAVAAPLLLLGAATVLVTLTFGALVLAAMIAGLIVVFAWPLSARSDEHQGAARLTAPELVVRGLLAGVALLAGIGMIMLLGPTGWWIDVTIAVAGWPALRRARTAGVVDHEACPASGPATARPPRTSVPATECLPREVLPELSALASLSTPQLCWAWRASYVRVERASCGSQLGHLAELRRGYLEELQRRDPVAFDRWLPTARAAGDPGRLFRTTPPTRPDDPGRRPGPAANPPATGPGLGHPIPPRTETHQPREPRTGQQPSHP